MMSQRADRSERSDAFPALPLVCDLTEHGEVDGRSWQDVQMT